MKLSRADLGFAVSQGRTGGTTVAATMIAAHMAGIKVFATGGIGGVHKGAEKSFDISADLDELARTPVIVVSAGAKAILDIEKTLEVLETRGVPVVAVGADVMPAFWSRQSPYPAPLQGGRCRRRSRGFSTTRQALGLAGGMLIANPVPESDEIPADEMAGYIEAAHQAAAGAEGDRQGGDAVPARKNARADRRREPEDQHRAGRKQCAAGGEDREGAVTSTCPPAAPAS